MSRTLPLALAVLLAAPSPSFAKGAMTVIQVSFTIEHQPDGKKHPNYVKESYLLDAAGLHYSAYFGGMPMDMNHMDSVEWKPGELGKKVFATALAVDKLPGMLDLPASGPSPDPGPGGVYIVTIRRNDADGGRFVKDSKSKAWARLDADFGAMLAAFEKQTGRPLTVGQLPQGTVVTPQSAAIAKALPKANAALAAAYKKYAKRPDAVAPPHAAPWVSTDGAVVSGDAKQGFTITWAQHAPAGFEFDAVVTISPAGKVAVTRADATFSPD